VTTTQSEKKEKPVCQLLPGLPDDIFSYQKSQFGINYGGPWNGKCLYILWPFGIFDGHLVYIHT
jgi:hypothetical protein